MNTRTSEAYKYKAPEQLAGLKQRVVKLQLAGFSGPLVFTDVENVLDEIRILLTADDKVGGEIEMEPGEKIVLKIGIMTLQEIDDLPEFQGY